MSGPKVTVCHMCPGADMGVTDQLLVLEKMREERGLLCKLRTSRPLRPSEDESQSWFAVGWSWIMVSVIVITLLCVALVIARDIMMRQELCVTLQCVRGMSLCSLGSITTGDRNHRRLHRRPRGGGSRMD